MTEPTLQDKIYSENYFDLILPIRTSDEAFLDIFAPLGAQLLGARFGMLHVPLLNRILPEFVRYSQIPKLFAPLDTVSLEVSGILRVQNQPFLGYTGENILIGFLDTGIDYTLDAFRRSDGSSRIVGLWDQTIPSEAPPYDCGYGTAYTNEDINRALAAENPYSIVPSRDENGHGTFVAGVAAGSRDEAGNFTGAAPGASIAMVRLKPAKQNLRNYFLIQKDALAFQETDIMMGIRYLLELSEELQQQLILCVALGTNQGDHSGNAPLERHLSYLMDYLGCFGAVAAGNEAGRAHHYYQPMTNSFDSSPAEILVDDQTDGFMLEIWAEAPDLFGVSITSPLGENIPRIPPRPGYRTTLTFTAERTVLEISYEIAEYASGVQLITLRFQDPTPGIWRLSVTASGTSFGSYHMWLPVETFISPGTVFLSPNPYTTLTVPSTSEPVLTVSTYDAYTGNLFIHSSRGYIRAGSIKPDFAAPGVNVYGPATNPGSNLPPLNKYTRKTGSSAACAITVGAAALLLNWNAERPFPRNMTNRTIKDYLTRAANRQDTLQYPNREWGYGTLNLYRVFETLM